MGGIQVIEMEDVIKTEFIQGQIEKKNYRKIWLKNAKKESGHPINLGIHMDTHHLISAQAIKISGLADTLIRKGYKIDSLNNLVGFPSTLPAACHLGTQLHRGDHIYELPGEEAYHDYVSALLSNKEEEIDSCYGRTEKIETDSAIHIMLDKDAEKVLRKINSFKIPLTLIFSRFKEGGVGCANCTDISPAIDSILACKLGRNHIDQEDRKFQDSKQKWNFESIKFPKLSSWKPKVGA